MADSQKKFKIDFLIFPPPLNTSGQKFLKSVVLCWDRPSTVTSIFTIMGDFKLDALSHSAFIRNVLSNTVLMIVKDLLEQYKTIKKTRHSGAKTK